MRINPFALLLASALFLTGCSDTETTFQSENETKVKQPEQKEAPLTLTDTQGNTIAVTKTKEGLQFAGHEGKAVLLNFYATWCPPCKAEIPHLNALQDHYKETFSVISVTLEEKPLEEIQEFVEYYTIDYTVTHGEPNFELAELVGGVSTIPYMVLYDPKGNYATHYVGAVPEEMIDADIQKALNL